MVQLSPTVKQIFSCYMTEGDITKMEALAGSLSDPRDVAVAQLFIAEYYLSDWSGSKTSSNLLDEVDTSCRALNDNFVICLMALVNGFLCYQRYGKFEVKSAKYAVLAEKLFFRLELEDSWEKFMLEGMYYTRFLKFRGWETTPRKIDQILVSIEKGLKAFSRIPGDGPTIARSLNVSLLSWYRRMGRLNSAETALLEALDVGQQFHSTYLPYIFNQLTKIYVLKGDLPKVREYNLQAIKYANEFHQTSELKTAYLVSSSYFFQQAKYQKSLAALQDCLQLSIQAQHFFWTFYSYIALFNHFYKRYHLTQDRTLLQNASTQLSLIESLVAKVRYGRPFEMYIHRAKALLLKHGSSHDKSQALELFRGIVNDLAGFFQYDQHEVALHLLDLLFETVSETPNPDLIQEIDQIMKLITHYPLSCSPHSIYLFISQKILLAKYQWFLQSDPAQATVILHQTLDQIRPYGLKELEHLLERELSLFKQQNNISDLSNDYSPDYSMFCTYLTEALDLVLKHPLDLF